MQAVLEKDIYENTCSRDSGREGSTPEMAATQETAAATTAEMASDFGLLYYYIVILFACWVGGGGISVRQKYQIQLYIPPSFTRNYGTKRGAYY